VGGVCGQQRRLGPGEIREFCPVDDAGHSLLRAAMRQLNMSARAYHRTLCEAPLRSTPDPGSPVPRIGEWAERAGWRGLSPTWPAQPLTRGTACRDRALGRGLCSIGRADRCESGLAAGVEEAWKAQVGAAGWHRTDLEGTVSFASDGERIVVEK